MSRTDSELEVVSRVSVDVSERFLHGQSEQHQLTEVVPAVLALLNTQTHVVPLNADGHCRDRNMLTCLSGERPDAAMYELPMVLIFSTSWK